MGKSIYHVADFLSTEGGGGIKELIELERKSYGEIRRPTQRRIYLEMNENGFNYGFGRLEEEQEEEEEGAEE